MWINRNKWNLLVEELRITRDLLNNLVTAKNSLNQQLKEHEVLLKELHERNCDPEEYEWMRDNFEKVQSAIRNIPKEITVHNMFDITNKRK